LWARCGAVSDYQAEVADPFDPHAEQYARVWGQDPVARLLRDEVQRSIRARVPIGSAVLDAGCGAGLDAERLLRQGYRVVAIDRSAGMVEQARRRGVPAQVLPVERAAELGPVDAALLNFGVINCVDAGAAAQALAGTVAPGGWLFLVPMPRLSPSWTLRELGNLRVGGALQRLAPWVDVPVEGGRVRTRYWSAAELVTAFAPWFQLEEQSSLGVLLPPPGSRRAPRLASLEAELRGLPLLRQVGDHLLLVLRRGERPASNLPSRPPSDAPLARLQARRETRRAARTGEIRRLRVLVLHLTDGCNSFCQSCGFRGPAGGEALTAEVAGELAAEARAMGCGEVLLTGGEPLLRSDIEALMRAVRLAGLRPTLLSNGLALARHAPAVARWCEEVVLSLDGHDAESYREIRGVHGLEAVRRGVQALRARAPGLPIRARVTVSRLNQGRLLEIARLAQELGMSGISYLAALEGGDAFGGGGPVEEQPLRPEPVALGQELAQLRAALPRDFLLDSEDALQRILHLAQGRRSSPRCDAPYTSVVVQPDLRLRPCFFLSGQGPDGRGADARLGLRAGLHAMGAALQDLEIASEPTCQGCVCWAKLT